MTYEEENENIRDGIVKLQNQINELQQVLKELDKLLYQSSFLSFSQRFMLQRKRDDISVTISLLKERLQGQQERLQEGPIKRKMMNLFLSIPIDKLPEPPRHVHGRVYAVSDGCFWWLLAFSLIGSLIIFAVLG